MIKLNELGATLHQKPHRWRFLYVAFALTSTLAIWLYSTDARRQLDALRIAQTDSAQWSLAQVEVEYLALQSAAWSTAVGATSIDQLRTRFDVFYSRIETISEADGFAEARARPEVQRAIGRVRSALNELTHFIDAPAPNDPKSAIKFAESVEKLDSAIRNISLSSVTVFSEQSDVRRNALAGAMSDLGIITSVLLAILLAVVGVLLVTMSGQQQKSKEVELTQSRLQTIISTSLDGILVVDKNGIILDFNGAAEEMFGYAREDAIGTDMAELIVPEHFKDAHNAGMKRYRETGEKRVVGSGLLQLEARRKNEQVFPVELSIKSAESEEGEIFVSYIRDISKRVAAESELVEARDKALAGEKAKAELLAVMSHEMRTPLNGVLGTLQLLTKTNLSQRQRKFVEVMEASGKMLLEHVNNVLDISRVDAGKADVANKQFDVLELVGEVVEGLEGQAEARGNTLSVSALGTDTLNRFGDGPRLRQILYNLIGNAIKFTEDGSVCIKIEPDPNTTFVRFRVSDTGIGIAEGDLERVFDDFVTLDTSYNRESEGTGLGLGIVRRLVHLLGGEIAASSEVERGSEFSFKIPLIRSGSAENEVTELGRDETYETETRPTALVVEDNETNRMVANEMLQLMGWNVVEAADGVQGVEVSKFEKFDLIIMDISMPRLNGIEASEQIRTAGNPNVDTPIVALTAHALPEDQARFQEADMQAVLTKPLSYDHLEQILTEFGPGNEADETERQSSLQESAPKIDPSKLAKIEQRAISMLSDGIGELKSLRDNDAEPKEISALAHSLAGSSALLEWSEISQTLSEIERCARELNEREFQGLISVLQKALEDRKHH